MLPRLGELFSGAVEVIVKPRAEYQSAAYAELGLPKAPAIMAAGEVIAEGRDIEEAALVAAIRRHLA